MTSEDMQIDQDNRIIEIHKGSEYLGHDYFRTKHGAHVRADQLRYHLSVDELLSVFENDQIEYEIKRIADTKTGLYNHKISIHFTENNSNLIKKPVYTIVYVDKSLNTCAFKAFVAYVELYNKIYGKR